MASVAVENADGQSAVTTDQFATGTPAFGPSETDEQVASKVSGKGGSQAAFWAA